MATNSSDVVAGTNGTALQYNNLRKDLVLGVKNLGSETDGTTVTFDLSDTTKGNIRNVVLAGNRTLAVTNATVGQVFILNLTQDETGSRTVTWFSTSIKWPDNVAPVLSTGANKTDSFGFICTGTGTYNGYIVGQNL